MRLVICMNDCLERLALVEVIKRQIIDLDESVHLADGDLRTEFKRFPRFTPNDAPDMGLIQVDNPNV